jgi:hypothetical protein
MRLIKNPFLKAKMMSVFKQVKVALLGIATLILILLVYWIIPTYVDNEKQEMVTHYSLVSASILALILNVITYGFEAWDSSLNDVIFTEAAFPLMGGKRGSK